MAAKLLRPADVPPILERLAAGLSYREVAAERGLRKCTVSDIAQGRSWRSIPGPRPDPARRRPLRPPRGSRNGQARLHESDIPKIRALDARGFTRVAIGKEFGVSNTTVRLIVTGKAWKHVPITTNPTDPDPNFR